MMPAQERRVALCSICLRHIGHRRLRHLHSECPWLKLDFAGNFVIVKQLRSLQDFLPRPLEFSILAGDKLEATPDYDTKQPLRMVTWCEELTYIFTPADSHQPRSKAWRARIRRIFDRLAKIFKQCGRD